MEVIPFRGWRFAAEAVGDPGLAISPPYDVIDDDLRRRLCERSPYNIVQVIRPDLGASETDEDRYTRAADLFRKWRRDGVLQEDPAPAVYVYGQTFEVAGEKRSRLGMIALARLEEFGDGVRAHEKTMGGPKEDRLRLTRATQAQFGQIFVLYSDPEGRIDALLEEASRGEPVLSATDDQGIEHRLWVVADPAKTKTVGKVMEDKSILIADGHHRYETALAYSRENRDLHSAEFQMMTFVNTRSEGVVILPTHRLVKGIPNFNSDEFLRRLSDQFEIETVDPDDIFRRLSEAGEKREHAFGIYIGARVFHLARIRDEGFLDAMPEERSAEWKHLDCSILHSLILDALLGIDEAALDKGSQVEYVKGIGDGAARAIEAVDGGRCQAAFFMNPPRMTEVEAVAAKGEKMPRKTTFFYPKVYSGLVIHALQ